MEMVNDLVEANYIKDRISKASFPRDGGMIGMVGGAQLLVQLEFQQSVTLNDNCNSNVDDICYPCTFTTQIGFSVSCPLTM